MGSLSSRKWRLCGLSILETPGGVRVSQAQAGTQAGTQAGLWWWCQVVVVVVGGGGGSGGGVGETTMVAAVD